MLIGSNNNNSSSNNGDVGGLFKSLMGVSDTEKIKQSLELYKGEDSKYFKTLIANIGDDLSKYKYVFDLVLKINKESPKTTFHDIYFKYLSTNNFQKNRDFFVFLNKIVLDDNVESLVYEQEDNDSHYNSIISALDLVTGVKLIKDFLSQRALNFEEYYYQKYLSTTEKLVNALENTVDINELYYRYPWFTGTITSKVYIASSNHDIDVFISNLNSPIVYKSKSWYKPNSLFYSYLSNQKHNRVLRGNSDGIPSLEFLDEKNKVVYSFHILYKLYKNDFKFSYLILDDNVYAMEKKFFAVDYDTCCDEYHVNLFLDDERMYCQSNIELVMEFFNKAMANIQSHYKITPAMKIPGLKSIRTLRELSKAIAEITVFLHLDSLSNSLFKKRVVRNYYKQNALFELKVEEKLPELLYDIEHIEVVSEFLYNSIECEIFNIGESVYRLSRKSMFKPLQKKKAHNPNIVLKYIDEIDNHNYTYYQKKEKWVSIKDILSQQITDDEYITDVIYPRMNEIYDYDHVMRSSISWDDFERKYSLLLGLLEDVMSKEEIYDKHKDLFLYYPDPWYGDEGDGVEIEELPVEAPVKEEEQVVMVSPEEVVRDVEEVVAVKKEEDKVEVPHDESVTSSLPPPPSSDVCSNCGISSFHLTTNTFVHSHDNHKKIKCICICYNCLEHHTLSDW